MSDTPQPDAPATPASKPVLTPSPELPGADEPADVPLADPGALPQQDKPQQVDIPAAPYPPVG